MKYINQFFDHIRNETNVVEYFLSHSDIFKTIKDSTLFTGVIDNWAFLNLLDIFFWQHTTDFLLMIWNSIKDFLWAPLSFDVSEFSTIFRWLPPNYQIGYSLIVNTAFYTMLGIYTIFLKSLPIIIPIITGLIKKILIKLPLKILLEDIFSEIFTNISLKEIFINVFESFKDSIPNFISTIFFTTLKILSFALDVFNAISDVIGGYIIDVIDGILEMPNNIFNFFKNFIGDLMIKPVKILKSIIKIIDKFIIKPIFNTENIKNFGVKIINLIFPEGNIFTVMRNNKNPIIINLELKKHLIYKKIIINHIIKK